MACSILRHHASGFFVRSCPSPMNAHLASSIATAPRTRIAHDSRVLTVFGNAVAVAVAVTGAMAAAVSAVAAGTVSAAAGVTTDAAMLFTGAMAKCQLWDCKWCYMICRHEFAGTTCRTNVTPYGGIQCWGLHSCYGLHCRQGRVGL
jgi:hypothetical protein